MALLGEIRKPVKDPVYGAKPQALALAPPPPALAPPPASVPAPQKPGPLALPTLQKTAVDPVKLDKSFITEQSALARRRAQQGESVVMQENNDAINRKLAQMGGGPGGVGLKLQQQSADESAKRLGEQNEAVTAQERAAMAQAAQLEQQMTLAREESQAGRDMQKYSADLATAVQKYGMDIGDYQFDVGQQTQKEVFEFQKEQAKFENDVNTKQGILSQLQNLKTSGYKPEEIDSILKGLGLEQLGINLESISGVTKRAPLVMPASGRLSDYDKAYRENVKNGYSRDEMQQAGMKGA